MTVRAPKKQATHQNHPTAVSHLLHLTELLQQTLEVKLEMLAAFPNFLSHALRQVHSRRGPQTLAELGEHTATHVRMLSTIVVQLGGRFEHDALTRSASQKQEPLSAYLFCEELAKQTLEECLALLHANWEETSELQRWLSEHIETVLSDTAQNIQVLDRLFTKVQPRFRDLVVERFRMTSLP